MKYLSILFALTAFSCMNTDKQLSADQIVNKAIAEQCQGNCDHATVEFTFRDRAYLSMRNDGAFQFTRTTQDSVGVIQDKLSNEGFERMINDNAVVVPDSMAARYGESVNSVIYFAQLPYGLNAPAVEKKLLGETTIKEQPYYEVQVTFKEEGGGTDHDDVFVYWIHKEQMTVDYLAYSYQVNGGGIRFREAYNERRENGIRFVDYNNYKPESLDIPVADLDVLFTQGKLKLLSKIETENVAVTLPSVQ
jgi:hypothetical protein